MPHDQPTPPAQPDDRRDADPLGDLMRRCKPAQPPLDPHRRDQLRTFLAGALRRE